MLKNLLVCLILAGVLFKFPIHERACVKYMYKDREAYACTMYAGMPTSYTFSIRGGDHEDRFNLYYPSIVGTTIKLGFHSIKVRIASVTPSMLILEYPAAAWSRTD